MFNPMTAWIDAAFFCADAQRVVALRVMRIAAGGASAKRETQRMVAEKVAAFGEAQIAAAVALASGMSVKAAAKRAEAPYRRRVRANRKRLLK